ncbi:MAG: crotonase/enoyl-CoA hydratase family protein [Candidatus Pelagadaptatus aseana]|uniref:crotonase/enoyl-CoA hydratase family protein n=1 Tax=Candidatus Pelagadaptatus aseana TaxID=3120508 RepID=UPI0039B18783
MPIEPSAVTVEKNGPVTTIILNRPAVKNAVNGPTALELERAFQAFEDDAEASVAVFYGDSGIFCAGADLKALANPEERNRVEPEGPGPMGPSRMLLSKPVIAAIEGFAVAGGLELALWCDMRVVTEGAVLGVFCRRWGVPLIDGGTVRLPRLIGQGHAMDLILTGRPVKSDEALAMGLVNRVVAVGQARAAAEALALEISQFPQACMKADRMSAYQQWDLDLPEALVNEGRSALEVLEKEAIPGAARFASGAGRHGSFE